MQALHLNLLQKDISLRAVNGYPLTIYHLGSKIDNGYPRKQRGQEKLTQEEQEDRMRDYSNLCSV